MFECILVVVMSVTTTEDRFKSHSVSMQVVTVFKLCDWMRVRFVGYRHLNCQSYAETKKEAEKQQKTTT